VLSASTLSVNAGYVLNDGNSGNNYTVTLQSASGSITQKALSASLSAQTKTYDGTTDIALSASSFVLSGFVSGESASITQTTGSFNARNVAQANSVSATLGSGHFNAGISTLLSNYVLPTTASGNGSITPRALSISGSTAQGRAYDGTNIATLNAGSLSGLVGSEFLSVTATGSFDSKNAGQRTATPIYFIGDGVLNNAGRSASVAGLASNYRLDLEASGLAANPGLVATITPAALTLSAVSNTKVYDGTTASSPTPSITGTVFAGDTLSGLSQAFNSKDVAAASFVSVNAGFTLDDGNEGRNYTVTTVTRPATITQRSLSTWTGKASGNWSSAANWDVLPDDGRNVAGVLIPSMEGLQVTYDLSALNLASLSNAARLRVNGANLTVGALTNNGTLDVNSNRLQLSSVTNNGVLTVSSALDLSGVQVAGRGQLSNQGQLTLAGSSVDQVLNNSGTVLASGSNTLASVVNSGAFTVSSGTTQVTAAFTQTGGTTTLGSTGAGSATLGAGEGFAFNAGRLAGTGTLSGNVNINNAVLAPGFSPGVVNVEGNLTLGSGATLEIELAGPDVHDQVLASGNLQLGGALLLSSLDGFRPTSTDRFNILSSRNSTSGTFSTVSTTGPNLETLLLANLQMTSASGTATIPADSSTLVNAAANSEIVTEIIKQTQSVTNTNDAIDTSSLGTAGLETSATRTLTPPAYVAPTPAPSPDSSASPSPAPSPSAARPAQAPAAGAAPAPAPAVPTVRKDEVKSLELDPAPAPAPTATSSKATSEVSYAKPDQGKAGDGKGSNASGTTSTGKDC
jgi:hypothetical protein